VGSRAHTAKGAARTACRPLGRRWRCCQCQPLAYEALGNGLACAGHSAMVGGGDVEGPTIRLFCGLSTPEIQASTSTAAGALEMKGADWMCASACWPTTPLLPGGHAVTNRRRRHARGVRAARVGYFSRRRRQRPGVRPPGRAIGATPGTGHQRRRNGRRRHQASRRQPPGPLATRRAGSVQRGRTLGGAARRRSSSPAATGCACRPGARLVALAGGGCSAVTDRTAALRRAGRRRCRCGRVGHDVRAVAQADPVRRSRARLPAPHASRR